MSEVKQKRSYSDIARCVSLVVEHIGEKITAIQLELKHIEDLILLEVDQLNLQQLTGTLQTSEQC